MYVDIHGQLFVAADVERSDGVHLAIGALWRLDYDYKAQTAHPRLQLFSFTQTVKHKCQIDLSPRARTVWQK